MRIIDAIPVANSFHKVNLVEDAGTYSVISQTVNRPAVIEQRNMTRDAATAFWKRLCLSHFYSVTRNTHDAEVMAERRISTFH